MDHSILEVMDRVYTSPTYLEFLPRGVHKGRCLRDLRCLDVLRGRRMVAVGDYTNDLELLAEADISVAVANALATRLAERRELVTAAFRDIEKG